MKRKDILRFITGIDLGIRYPAYLYNSHGNGFPITLPNQILQFNLEYQRSLNGLSKEEQKQRKKDYKNALLLIYDYISDSIINMTPLYSVIAMEKISIRVNGWMSLLNTNILRDMIINKAKSYDRYVLTIDPVNTSITCPRCGNIDKTNRYKMDHIYHCDHCGLMCNDDMIAAWNIHNRAMNQLFDNTMNTWEGKKPVMIWKEPDYEINELKDLLS